tara:strand:- start:420 stop:590 length:171 start_codon:yes stop_codon:yes gene_type:complete
MIGFVTLIAGLWGADLLSMIVGLPFEVVIGGFMLVMAIVLRAGTGWFDSRKGRFHD